MMKHSDKEEEINCFNFLLLSAEKEGWNVRGGAIIFLFSFNPQNGGKQKSKKEKKIQKNDVCYFLWVAAKLSAYWTKKIFNLRKIKIKPINGKACK